MSVALVAQTVEDAKAAIRAWVKECAEGKGDRELEAIGLAALWSIDLGDVRKAFKDAREVAKAPADVGIVQREPRRAIGESCEAFQARIRKWKEGLAAAKTAIELKVVEHSPKIAPSEKPEEEEAEAKAKASLPALIPTTKPLTNERVSGWDDAMAAMNEQHALIENVGNKTVIASWEPSPTNLNRRVLVFQGKDSFLLRYSNQMVSLEIPDGRDVEARFSFPLNQVLPNPKGSILSTVSTVSTIK